MLPEMHRSHGRIRNQVDVTYYFIVFLICSIRFGHYYARNLLSI